GAARVFDLRGFQHTARERQALDFERACFHLLEQFVWRRAGVYARGQAAEARSRVFFLQVRVNLNFHFCARTRFKNLRSARRILQRRAEDARAARSYECFSGKEERDFRRLPCELCQARGKPRSRATRGLSWYPAWLQSAASLQSSCKNLCWACPHGRFCRLHFPRSPR